MYGTSISFKLGFGWEIPVNEEWKATVKEGPLGHHTYRLFLLRALWGSSEHSIDGKFYQGELHFELFNTRYVHGRFNVYIYHT